LFGSLALLCILLALVSSEALPTGAISPLVVTFLNVGHGDAVWVRGPDGQDLLVDGGYRNEGPDLAAYLRARGCNDIEYMLVTHPDADHIGGLITVLQEMPVRAVWYNGQAANTETSAEFFDLVNAKAIPITALRAGQNYAIGSLALAVLHPATLGADDNNNSIVCRLSYGAIDLLLTGDVLAAGESAILAAGYPVQAEVLKVAHHGADDANSEAFLRAVLPAAAIVSYDGPPDAIVAQRLAALGARIYRTDLHGDITLISDGVSYSVMTMHNPAATLSGRVYLQGRSNHTGVTIRVGGFSALTGADGAFTLVNAPLGAQTVEASRSGFLKVQAANVQLVSGQQAALAAITLPAGDIDGNGEINLFDLVTLAAAYGACPPADARLDLNGDGCANLLDLVLLAGNYNRRGPLAWGEGIASICIRADEAAQHVGETTCVEFDVVRAHNSVQNVYLDSHDPYQGYFYVMIRPALWGCWSQPPEQQFSGKRVRVQGRIQTYNGSPEIILEDCSKIEPVGLARR
jgi:beta-lactamase superfamily II metal-dependent hydrolase